MVEKSEKKPWYEVLDDLYQALPESDNFDEDIADKQIEGIMEMIVVIGSVIYKQDKEIKELRGEKEETIEAPNIYS